MFPWKMRENYQNRFLPQYCVWEQIPPGNLTRLPRGLLYQTPLREDSHPKLNILKIVVCQKAKMKNRLKLSNLKGEEGGRYKENIIFLHIFKTILITAHLPVQSHSPSCSRLHLHPWLSTRFQGCTASCTH